MKTGTYKFAIMLNREELYPWQIKVLEEIQKTGLAECVLIIVRKEKQAHQKNIFQKITQKNLLFEQYKKRKLNPTLYAPKQYAPIKNVEKIEVEPIRTGKNNEQLNQQEVEQIKSRNLDFIIRFGFGILKGEVLQAARWGIWSYHHADEQEFRGGPAGYWEIVKKKNIQGVILQQLTEKLDAGKIILKRHFHVLHDSYAANVTKLHIHSADMPAQAITMISKGLMQPDSWVPVTTKAPIYHYPTNFQFIRFACQMLINKIKASYIRIFKQENWMVISKENNQVRYMAPKANHEYYADPFILSGKDENLIIAEHYSYKTRKGNIVVIKPGINQSKTVIEKDTHLSYPFVYNENGKTFVIPEESGAGKVNLYQWNEDTYELDFKTTLLDLPVIDPSILKHNGKYYLMGGIKDECPNEKLYIYFANQLEGPYVAHPKNPVKCDPRGSRMGGGFIPTEDGIIRPGQYSVKHYGEKLWFFKINTLNETDYEETFQYEMTPDQKAPFKCGLHNYHKIDTFEVYDQKTMSSGYLAFKAQL